MSILDKASLIQIPSGYKSTKLYSIEPTNGDGDFTFARSSSGTRVNSEGLIEVASVLGSELVVNGDFATDSDWSSTEVATIGISGGSINFSSTSSNKRIQNIGSIIVGKKYIVNYDIVSISEGSFAFQDGVSTYTYRSSIGSYSEEITASGTFIRIRTAGTTTGSIDNVSVKEVITNNVPRLDYSGGASCASLLLEGQSTNLLPYSNDFTQWTIQSGVTATHNTTETLSPDGTNNATKFVGNGSAGVFYAAIAVTGVITRSIYLKSIVGTVNVILKDPNITITSKSLTVTTEWQRFDLAEDNGTSSQGIWISNIPVSGVYMWGAQLEQGSYPTSYIPTIGSTVTRTADVCNNAGTSATFNSTEGVLFAEIAALEETSSSSKYITISDETYNNRLSVLFSSGATDQIRAFLRVGGVSQVDFNGSVTDVTDYNKVAFKYKANDFALWINGVEVATDISGSVFSADTLTKLSFSEINTTSGKFEGKTKQLMVFNEALSDEELSDLTGQINLSFNNLATFYGYTIL